MDAARVLPKLDHLIDDGIAVLHYAAEAAAAGIATALVTLTEVRGGASRRLGSQMVVLGDGRYRGFVSGGCVEAAAAAEALEAIAWDCDREVRFGKDSPFFDIVLPCGGGITLSIHVLRSPAPLLHALDHLQARRAVTLRYQPHNQSLDCVTYAGHAHWAEKGFNISFLPHTRVVICGASIEAQATAALGRSAGYEIHSWQPGEVSSGLIDQHSAVILLFHDLEKERVPLHMALDAAPFYIGALGSRATHQHRTEMLLQSGYTLEQISRIKAPIGLFPKARDAYSLALSVLADVASARTFHTEPHAS